MVLQENCDFLVLLPYIRNELLLSLETHDSWD